MKTILGPLQTALAQDVTGIATCWLIRRTDGVQHRYTGHDQDLEVTSYGAPINGTYKSSLNYSGSTIESKSDSSPGNLDITAFFDDPEVSETDLVAGLFDHAEVWLFAVDWSDTSKGIVKLRRGHLGEFSFGDDYFRTELRDMMQLLQQDIGEVCTPTCRAVFGDERCGVDLGALEVSGTLTAVTDQLQFADSARAEADGYFQEGVITFDDGPNAGISLQIKSFSGGFFVLHEATPYDPGVNDAYTATPGCDLTFPTCRDTYANSERFHGEPHLPGPDEANRYIS